MGKAKLIHLINEAWLKCELKRMADYKIDWLLLAVVDDKEQKEVEELVKKVANSLEFKKVGEFGNIEDWEIQVELKNSKPKRGFVTIITEEWYKEHGYIPDKNYDSVLFSHGVHDIFFKRCLITSIVQPSPHIL